jgi:negative regulator of flagellin synthesis FlgM
MTIEIQGSNQAAQALANTVTGNGNAPARNEPNNVASGPAPSAGLDTVSLTGTAQHLRSLEQSLASQPVVDTQKVEATRQAIENGSYQIDPNRIANKMISLERALSGAH